MINKRKTFYGAICIIAGMISGIAGTAYAFGSEQRYIKDTLIRHTMEITANEASVQKEMDRYAEIMAAQMTYLQESIRELTTTIYDLRTDVQVLNALMERVEEDLKNKSNSD